MKKFILGILILGLSLKGLSQTCEERESKLLEVMGSLSAGFLYNTYGLIGSIADGYNHDAYSPSAAEDLMIAQKKLADNMIILLEKLVRENAFREEADKNYISSSVAIIKGFRIQADLFLNVIKNNSQKNLNAYEDQRDKNWKDISKLMGVPG